MSDLIAVLNNGTYETLATCSTLKVLHKEIANATRNTLGAMVKDRIAQKWQIEATWKAVTAAQMARIRTLTDANTCQVRFIDPVTNAYIYAEMYLGDDFDFTPLTRYDGGFAWFAITGFSLTEV